MSGIDRKITGTYMDIIFSKESNKKFDSILKDFGLEKDFNDKYHCTLIYSKKVVPFLKTSKGTKQEKNKAGNKLTKLISIKGFGHFDTNDGKNLHVILECSWCEAQHKRAIKAGAITDYPEYVAHVTLMYNCKDFKIDDKKFLKYVGEKIEIIEERITPLNENWVDDSKKDK